MLESKNMSSSLLLPNAFVRSVDVSMRNRSDDRFGKMVRSSSGRVTTRAAERKAKHMKRILTTTMRSNEMDDSKFEGGLEVSYLSLILIKLFRSV